MFLLFQIEPLEYVTFYIKINHFMYYVLSLRSPNKQIPALLALHVRQEFVQNLPWLFQMSRNRETECDVMSTEWCAKIRLRAPLIRLYEAAEINAFSAEDPAPPKPWFLGRISRQWVFLYPAMQKFPNPAQMVQSNAFVVARSTKKH